ncbi:MAG: hypothetical protein KIT73_06965, partial [Burkholderiales bacterium]|nr:hypothetical protein [Burkholderiales bacterium]
MPFAEHLLTRFRRLFLAGVAVAVASVATAADDAPRLIALGATAGPYADQIKEGIKPLLEKKGYKVKVVEFSDYVQPNLALVQGAIHANVFQNPTYLARFGADHKLDLIGLIEVPTAPIGLYSRRHRSLADVRPGQTIVMPNDPTNQARSLAMLEGLGWIKLRAGADPLRVSERDIETNLKQVRIRPLEAAQTPRALGDVDFAFVNGNFAVASGLKLNEAVALEKTPPHYMIVVTVNRADADKRFVKDIVDAYRSPEFRELTLRRYA